MNYFLRLGSEELKRSERVRSSQQDGVIGLMQKLVFWLGCLVLGGSLTLGAQTLSFSGNVVGTEAKLALSGVRVSLVSELGEVLRSTVTGGDGSFFLAIEAEEAEVAGGEFTLDIEANGYEMRKLFYAGGDLDGERVLEIGGDTSFFTDGSLEVVLRQIKVLGTEVVRSRIRLSDRERQAVTTTTLSEEDVESIKIRDARDLSGVSANLLALNSESSLGSFFSLRGITSINTLDPLVVIYIDGVAQFLSQSVPLHFVNIESIRILKGPQLTLYGRNSMAGVIDIRTKKPTNPFSFVVSAEGQFPLALRAADTLGRGDVYTFDDTVNIGTFLPPAFSGNLFFSTPFFLKDSYMRVSAGLHNNDGIVSNTTFNKMTGGEFSAEADIEFFLPITTAIGVHLSGGYDINGSEIYPYAASLEEAKTEPFVVHHDSDNYGQRSIAEGVMKVTAQLKYFDLTSVTTYNYYVNGLFLDADFSFSPLATAKADIWQNTVTQEVRIASSSASEKYFSWLVGVYLYARELNFATIFHLLPLSSIEPASRINGGEFATGTALFSSVTIPFGYDRFALVLGGRVDFETRYFISTNVTTQDANNPEITSENPKILNNDKGFSKFYGTGKTALSVQLVEDLLYVASFSTGFRSGGVNLLTTQDERLLYDDEYSLHSEMGLRLDTKVLTLSGTIFHIYWIRQQLAKAFPDSPGVFEFGVENQEIPSHNYGIEFETDLRLLFGFGLDGNFGLTRSDFGLYTPMITATAGLKHFYISKNKVIKLVNRIEGKFFSTVFYELDDGDPNTEEINQPSYALVNLSSSIYIGETFLITLWAKNLLDERYLAFVLPFGRLPSVSDDQELDAAKTGDPLTIGLKIGLSF